MEFHTKKFSTIIIVSLLTVIMTSAVYADVIPPVTPPEQETYGAFSIKDGTYIGAFVTLNQMSGDFDDSTWGRSGSDIYDYPDVDNGTGLGVLLGFRAGRKMAVELGYQRSRHDASGEAYGDGDATYSEIDLNIKIDVFARDRIRPYILFGLGVPWLTVEDGLYTYPYGPEDVEDETFVGFGLNIGAGAAYYFRPDLALTGGVIYRWNRFSSVSGSGSLDDALIEKALCFRIGVAYTF